MYCPRCHTERELVGGICPVCGYTLIGKTSPSPYVSGRTVTPPLNTLQQVARGDVLNQGRYRLVKQLPPSENQQGASWAAIDTALSRRHVVIREALIPAHIVGRERRAQVMQSISQRLATLGQHPGLADVFDVFEEQGHYYIVFAEIEGETLASLLQRQGGALPEQLVVNFGWQLCDILSLFIRQQPPFIHGNINQSTIIVKSDNKSIALIDLPLFSGYVPTTKDASVSAYLAPEQARGSVEPSSDLFAVAAVLHHMVTGYDPRERVAFFYPPARRLNPAITPALERILGHQLHISTAQRYSNPMEMQAELGALLETYTGKEQGLQETPLLFTDPMSLNREQRREWSQSNTLLNVGVFVAVLVLVLVGLLFIVLH